MSENNQISKKEQKVNVDELKKIVETEKKESEPNYLSLGITGGFCLGMILAIVFNNLSLGIGIGMCIGIAGAIFFAYKNVKVDDKENETSKEE
ncbi:MAG: hypothetical protein J6A75_03800 [Lachnospiraceae bacterium]|nr:hypothetical protein [Lachnospiraceae bacterium]